MRRGEYHVLAALEEEHWWYRALRRRLLERLEGEARRKRRPLRIFDAGCGTGGWLQVLSQRADVLAAEGCDVHPLALSYAQSRGLKVQQRSVNELEGLPGGWDVVSSIDVLYHQNVQPERALEGMATLLAPGGLLLLNVAAMPCLARHHDRNVMGARRFLPSDLRRHVEAAGLRVEEMVYWNSWLTPLLWIQIQLEKVRSVVPGTDRPTANPRDAATASELQLPPPWSNRSLLTVLELERRFAKQLPLPWGSSLLLTARKPFAGMPASAPATASDQGNRERHHPGHSAG